MTAAPFFAEVGPERGRQLRAFAALVAAFTPPTPGRDRLVGELRAAEEDAAAVPAAMTGFEALPSLTRRRILSTFARLHRPQAAKETVR